MIPVKKTFVKPLRDKFGHFVSSSNNPDQVTRDMVSPETSKPKKPVPVKRGASKSDVIHTNGLTRPLRDEKGHFAGSESIADEPQYADNYPRLKRADLANLNTILSKKLIPDRIDRNDISFETVHNPRTGKDYTVGKLVKPSYGQTLKNAEPDYLKLYRVFNNETGGYMFVLSKTSLSAPSADHVMTLYNPKSDIIALDRAIKKYSMDNE